jgi:hypothetical protein
MRRLFFLLGFVFSVINSFSQPTIAEIKRFHIRSVVEIFKQDTTTTAKKTVYNKYGQDSLIYYDGKLSFYSEAKVNSEDRIEHLLLFNAHNKREEELHLFKYKEDGSYIVEVIAHGAGLIDTEQYNSADQLLRSISSDDIETIFQYNKDGKLEKLFQQEKKGKRKLIAYTKFDGKGLEHQTEIFGEEPAIIFYEHNLQGLVTKVRMTTKEGAPKKETETSFQYEFHK